MSRAAMQVYEPAFICCKTDIEDIFHRLSQPDDKISAHSVWTAYRHHLPDMTESEIERGFQRFVTDYCSVKHGNGGIDLETFQNGLEQAAYRIAAQGKGDELLNRLGAICVDLADNDPLVFARMLNLPSALKVSEIQDLMAYVKS